jgi:hypothetical protein
LYGDGSDSSSDRALCDNPSEEDAAVAEEDAEVTVLAVAESPSLSVVGTIVVALSGEKTEVIDSINRCTP